jgi:hypothetical protein
MGRREISYSFLLLVEIAGYFTPEFVINVYETEDRKANVVQHHLKQYPAHVSLLDEFFMQI